MAKKDYFSHDYHAREHLRDVRKDWGLAGYGFYWCIVEILHENGGYIKESDVESIAYDLRAEPDLAKAVLYDYDMFQVKKGKIISARVLENLQKREEISQKRREAAGQRWERPDESEIPELVISEDDGGGKMEPDEMRKHREFYADNIEKGFNKWLEETKRDDLFEHTIYDYRSLFETIVQEVRNKDYLYINGQKVPTYYYLYKIQYLIKDDTTNLDKAIRDVENRYRQGKVKNKLQYMIAALFNAERLDTL